MTKNPFLNALAASAYIFIIVSVINYMGNFEAMPDPGILAPLAMLSLLVLSAAVMGYIFFYQPLQLYLDGNKKEGVSLFLRTIGVFAGITLLVFCALIFAVRV